MTKGILLVGCLSLASIVSYASTAPTTRDRAIGALVGLAMGDALGTTFEFVQRDSYTPLVGIVGGGKFGLPAGKWTDDTSMVLCLADSLLTHRGELDQDDLMTRFYHWWGSGYNSSMSSCVDIGNTVRSSLLRYAQTGNPAAGPVEPTMAGNGALMRLAPVAILAHNNPSYARLLAVQQTIVTHGTPECKEASRLLTHILCNAINGATTKSELFDVATFQTDLLSVHELAHSTGSWSWQTKERYQIQSTGYVMHSLEAALWAIWRSDSAHDALLLAANLGGDADTIAAITGQIAGAFYGFEALKLINTNGNYWFPTIYQGSLIAHRAEQLFELGSLSEKDRAQYNPYLPTIQPHGDLWPISSNGRVAEHIRPIKQLIAYWFSV